MNQYPTMLLFTIDMGVTAKISQVHNVEFRYDTHKRHGGISTDIYENY